MKSYLALIVILMAGCGKPLPELHNVNLEAWRADRNGCAGARAASIAQLKDQAESLKALSEMQIVKLLGKPDQNELYKRNQKFYYYFLSGSPACPQPADTLRKLSIRFNAMGLAKEVVFE